MPSDFSVPAARRTLPVDGYPVVGALPRMLKQRIDYLVEARRRHGDVYAIDVGITKVIALNHPRHAQHVLRDNARNYPKGGPFWASIRSLLGNGLPVSEGDFWLRQRRMIQPHFHHERLAAMVDLMIQAIDDVIAGWDALAASGEPFNIALELARIATKVIVTTLFGSGISTADADRVGADLCFAMDFMFRAMITQSLPKWVPAPGRRRFEGAVEAMDKIIFDVIARRRREGTGGGELIGMLLDMVDAESGERMTDQQLRDEAVSFFLAGYETTAASLAWTFHFLTQEPDRLCPIEAEIAALGGRRPGFGDLRGLSQSLAAFQEALRLLPVAYWISRTAANDDEIDGFHIRKGATIGVMVYAMHRHPEIWEDPERFDPGRFSPERSQGRPALAWIPFGGGQRLCVGKDFALMEGQLILARILQRYRLEAVPGRTAEPRVGTTLRAKDGVWIRIARRA